MKPTSFRAAFLAIFTSISLALILLFLHQLVLPMLATFLPELKTKIYDLGAYGAAPEQDYFSFNLSSPRTSDLQWDKRCEDGFVLITPSGPSVPHPGPVILNSRGELLWRSDSFEVTTNLKIQQYRGQNYLTFWSGKKADSTGKGIYYMVRKHPEAIISTVAKTKQLDSSYNVVFTISAIGANLHGDLHEFKITPNNTALLTVYNVTTADLSPLGRSKSGWIKDSVFQEIDIATGQLLFEWRASDHFPPHETHMTQPFAGYIESIPMDFFHINSVDKDSQGNYLISSRHLHSIVCVSPTGKTLWILGGKHSQFTDLSDGQATGFKWQHDARWVSEDDGIMTLFDNQEGGILHREASHSSGLMLHVDVANRTAELLHAYTSLQRTRASSQGSLQVLSDTGNVFIGWGHSPVYSEFDGNGTLLCETHFGASWMDFWGRVVSYRAYKTTVGEWREDH